MRLQIFKSLRSQVVKAAAIVAESRNLALATVLFGLTFIALDAALLPQESKVGRVLHGRPPSVKAGYVFGSAIIVDSEIRFAPRHPDHATPILAFVDCVYEPRRIGLWAITREKYDATMTVSAPDTLSNEMLAEIRSAFSNHLATEPDIFPPYVEWVRRGQTNVDRVVWSGYLHNAITTIVAAVAVGILFLGSVRVVEGRRVRRAIRDGCCPSCGYDLRGRAPTSTVCPECGLAVHANLRHGA